MNLYVYYRIPLAEVHSLAARIRAMQATLSDVASRIDLLKRPDTDAPEQTWMEIYEDVAPTFDERLAAALVAHGLDAATRHVERFVPVA